ncbi:alpha/beta hydrolase [Cryptosporangium phraense]|uniref:Alpha/beta hydrolase n=1 Tax=Cryptosporangium phraense TaxID=2593070 RepID=A0A545AIF6_9ACTN|nr:alpha/beta hydrolase [Cryptosporangium phraense]TQS41099.1 alpha/beta hydrolase [Cryptosporangium phraense]
MKLIAETSSNGVVEREFRLGDVPGILWTTRPEPGQAPLVLMGHGGGQHKRAPGMVGRAHRLVLDGGFDVVTLDAPAHGGRPRTGLDEREIALMREAMTAGEPVGEIVARFNGDLAERAVPEWRAVLDAIDPEGPVGYLGIALATAIGVPLVAAEPRISAAVLGVFWGETLVETARQITVPIEFLHQWDDEHITRESGLSLFDAFGSKEKTLHASSGGHADVPRFEVDSAVRFFSRHLISAG